MNLDIYFHRAWCHTLPIRNRDDTLPRSGDMICSGRPLLTVPEFVIVTSTSGPARAGVQSAIGGALSKLRPDATTPCVCVVPAIRLA
jgi:hypothetical protein